MASPPNDFKVTGKGFAPASDEEQLRERKMIEGAIEQGVMKAITNDAIVAGGNIDQQQLASKIGKIDQNNPSGILAETKKYIKSIAEIDRGFAPGSKTYVKYRLTIFASALQSILVENGVLTLPAQPAAEPAPPPAEQNPPKEENTTPAPSPPPEDVQQQQDREEEEDEAALEPDRDEEEQEEQQEKIPPKKVLSEDPSRSKSETEIVGETHIVTTIEDPLRIRTGPSLENKVIGRLKRGSRVRVVNEALGEDCRWHKIEIVSDKVKDARTGKSLKEQFKDRVGSLYSHGSYLKKLEEVPESLMVNCDYLIDINATEPDWRKTDPLGMSCFYNLKKAEYQTVVEMPYQNEEDMEADYDFFEQSKPDIIEVGVRKLLYYYNKVSSEEYIKKVLNAFKGAYIPTGAKGFYLDKRPGSFMRFLVCFPAKYFNAIPTKDVDLSSATENNTDPNLRSYSFAFSTLQPKIELVAKRMDEYFNEVEKFDGKIEFINLKKEAQRLREFPASLINFLSINGHPTDNLKKELNIEIGFGEDFNLQWVFMSDDDKKTFPLKIGIVQPEDSSAPDGSLYKRLYPNGFGFKFFEPVKNRRTLAYIYYLDKMVEAINRGKIKSVIEGKQALDDLTWSKFVESFTFPIPIILPSAQKEEDRVEKNPSAKKVEKIVKQKEKKYTKPPGQGKTVKELKKENKDISNPQTKNAIAKGRAKKKEPVGDDIFDEAEHLLKSIPGLEGLYKRLLNKYDISALSEIAMSFLVSLIPFPDLEKLKIEASLDIIPADKIDNILQKIRNIDPKLYDKAMKAAQQQIEEYKEAGLEKTEDLQEGLGVLADQVPFEIGDQGSSFAGFPPNSSEIDALTVDMDTEPSTNDITKTPKAKSKAKPKPKGK
jgi:hypothetical protein